MNVPSKIIIREILLVAGVFVVAFLFRLWFITLAPQPFYWDQDEYDYYARKIYDHPYMLAAHTYRSYPYPLLMAVVYKFTEWGNHGALYVTNALLDAATAVMIYLILSAVTKKKSVAWLAFCLYAINPFTSGYVGMGLSEILATFFIVATILSGLAFIKRPSLLMGVIFGFFAGMAAETRNAAFAWAGVPITLSLFFVSWKKYMKAYLAIAVGLILTVLYPVYTNWREYHQFSITKVDDFYAMELYNGATLKILPPFTLVYPQGQYEMWREYWSEFVPERTAVERKAIADKYWNKALDIIRADPADYIRWRFFKMWYVWQKENIFFIKEPNYESHRLFTYYGNLALLILAMTGIITGLKSMKNRFGVWVFASFVGTILYGTIAFSFSHAEYRLTIPFYPVVISLASLGVAWVIEKVRSLQKQSV